MMFSSAAQGNTIRCTTTNGPNLAGLLSHDNGHKGGAWQHEVDLGSNGGGYVFRDEYRILRPGTPYYWENRSGSDGYTGPYGGMTSDAIGASAAKLRYYNQWSVDYNGVGDDSSLTAINPP